MFPSVVTEQRSGIHVILNRWVRVDNQFDMVIIWVVSPYFDKKFLMIDSGPIGAG